MGREIRRVPLDFDWPLCEKWKGFLNPLGGFPPCPDCSYEESPTVMDRMFPQPKMGTGLTPEAYALSQTFYAHQIASAIGYEGFGVPEGAKRLAWHDKLGQAEVDNLVARGRLSVWVDGNWESVPRTAKEVNEANHSGGLGAHDAINRWMLVAFRCEQLGIEHDCPTCAGNGDIATSEEREAYENWEPTDPPEGDGWQLWETVSEGSPISPVFATAEGLVDYLSTNGDAWKTVWRREAAEAFVKAGWAPTMVGIPGKGLFMGGEDADRIAEAGER